MRAGSCSCIPCCLMRCLLQPGAFFYTRDIHDISFSFVASNEDCVRVFHSERTSMALLFSSASHFPEAHKSLCGTHPTEEGIGATARDTPHLDVLRLRNMGCSSSSWSFVNHTDTSILQEYPLSNCCHKCFSFTAVSKMKPLGSSLPPS